MPKYDPDLDPVFRALAHPARRAVVERLGRGPAATTELAERRAIWEKRLDQLDEHLQSMKETDDG